MSTPAAIMAAQNADDVDRQARFPSEFLAEAKRAKLLGAYVPTRFGGLGGSISDLSAMCAEFGESCAASGMIMAMHQIQVACLVHHGLGAPEICSYVAEIAERQLLIGSVTSEVGIGGDLRSSLCALEPAPMGYALVKDAPTISYGAQADDLLVTARRAPDAAAADQVAVVMRNGTYALEQTSSWDTVGMRGTCSPGFRMVAQVDSGYILPIPFADVASQTMVPVSHILWASTWLGIATAAVKRAHTFVREQARKNPGTVPPAASHLAEVWSELQTMRHSVRQTAAEYETSRCSPGGLQHLSTLAFSVRVNNLKLTASRQVVDIVNGCMMICGLAGYKNDSRFGLGRQLRDAYSAPLMVANDRIVAANASMLLVLKEEL
ncbi:MAG TPA: acyl-CoA dehydrogenase family protein [Chloroflexota bacterium]|jgi:acyl-CoA dehydrogenase|nr:acyl-CoA dehydrogenase family protein [Chloroflexota bacterium]